MPSRTYTAGHTKAFIYPVMDKWGNVKVLRHKADSNRRPVGPQSNTPTTRPRDEGPNSEDQLYTPGPQWEIFSLMGGSSVKTAVPRVGPRPSPGGLVSKLFSPWRYDLNPQPTNQPTNKQTNKQTNQQTNRIILLFFLFSRYLWRILRKWIGEQAGVRLGHAAWAQAADWNSEVQVEKR